MKFLGGSLLSRVVSRGVIGDYPVKHILTNSSAELGNTTGWTNEIGNLSIETGGLSPYHGIYYFYGGSDDVVKASQEVNLISDGISATDIDTGLLKFCVDWAQASWLANDTAEIILRFKNTLKETISEIGSGLETVSPEKTWGLRTFQTSIPIGTRYIDIILHHTKVFGTSNNAYIDSVSCFTTSSSTVEPHIYRFIFKELQGGPTNAHIAFAELEFKTVAEGSDILDSEDYTIAAFDTYSIHSPSNIVDNNINSLWDGETDNGVLLTNNKVWLDIRFDIPLSEDLVEYTLRARDNASYLNTTPTSWELFYWSGSEWTLLKTESTTADWTASEIRSFNI